ncbi:MAG TPA: Do family serine endopeptidase [Thermoanaerobaculia bacterium]|jgi:serine protease Do|nr:Do family serine endopeptidase [Thermoanaerobaculia bacterium]
MSSSTKRILSTIAIIIASVAFGILISADLGLMKKSSAQTTAQIQTSTGTTTAVTIPSFADVAARVMPAVVSITTTEIVKTSDMRRRGQGQGGIDPFDFFFGPGQQRRGTPNDQEDDEHAQRSGGSGFIISPDGYILTNNHVVEGASKVDVHMGADENGNGGRTVQAKIIGRDPQTDIALIKIESTQPLPTVPLGDSERIRKGDWAIAVGNPFQFENTLTVGVISAKGRSLGLSQATQSFENFIQTDAAINFGNSGGPLMNINGEVIGINTAIRGGAQGLGFATPINTAKRLLPQLREGKVVRSFLGMNIQEVNEQSRQAFGLNETRGALVQNVTPGKPADKAGLEPGDVIVEIDSKKINNNRELIDYISYLPVGTKVNLAIIRNGQRRNLTATTAERDVEQERAEAPASEAVAPTRNKLGLSVQDLTAATRQMYSVDDRVSGVVVTDVKEVSPAGEVGISEGDVISEVQGQKITSVSQFRDAVDRLRSGTTIRMYVTTSTRGGQSVSAYRFLQVP